MIREVEAKGLFVGFLLISLHIWSCSGTLVGFSYDATHESLKSWSPKETLSFLHKNNVHSNQFRVFLSKPEAFLDSLSDTQIPVDLFLNPIHAKELVGSKSPAISWIETQIVKHLPHLNISTVVVNTAKHDLIPLLLTLDSISMVLQSFDLGRRIKVSPMFSLTDLEKNLNLPVIMRIVKKTESFVFVDTHVDRELNLGDGFVHSVIKRALSACSCLLPYPEVPVVLNVKSSVVPSGVDMAEFSEKLTKSMDNYPQLKDRISGLFFEISPLAESEQKKLAWQKEVIFPTSHRQLFGRETVTIHDTVAPITVPSTTAPPDIITVPSTTPSTILPTTSPITVPSTNPTATPITFPSTNPTTPPITVPATNPVTNPVTTPITNPVTTPVTNPVTTPVTNPVTTPVTNPTTAPVTVPPVMPITNPVTTPITNPINPPPANPGTTYPFPPPFSVTPATGMPSTVPITPATGTPAVQGQTWCVAKSGVPDNALQNALDYACGIGGADCSVIQMSGSCYNPNSLQAHASYAYNSYYQKNPSPTSCDFGGTAMLVTTNPSTGTCIYPSSSSASNLNPANPAANTGTGLPSNGIGIGPTGVTPTYGSNPGSGSSVLNTNNSAVFGSDSPEGTMSSGALCQPGGWILLADLVFVGNLLLLQ